MTIKISRNVENRITVSFPYNPDYIAKIKTIQGYRWHPEEKYWSLPLDNDILDRLASLFEDERLEIDPFLQTLREKAKPMRDFEDLRRDLVSRKYSPKTIKTYIYYNEELLRFAKKSHMDVVDEDIKNYLFYLADEKDSSASTLNIAINALKFYYGGILKKNFAYEIKRPKKDKKLPVVLSRFEISQMLSSVSNIKHRAILMLTYSAGLRVSEVVKLRYEDIDAERKLIHLKSAKGRKDRYTMLSDVALETIRKYLKEYGQSRWLFPGQDKENHMTTRTVEKIFSNTCKKANIEKDVTVHSLRHSFATHLLECSTDLRYIQEVLGHKSSKTTEIYTHVSNRDIGKIKSPLDSLQIKGGEDDD